MSIGANFPARRSKRLMPLIGEVPERSSGALSKFAASRIGASRRVLEHP
jgi:hypothetical protein